MSLKSNLVLYEIYPRSFKDSTGNGYGDLQGIIAKLDYLKELGINAVWLTPFFPSPMKDGGYDITDYTNVSPEFGTLNDFKELLHKAHEKNIKVVIDIVVNHTSDQHPWFIESRSSKDNPKRDWYIWKDPVNGGVPNNWKSVFEPSAWKFDDATQQYYLHSFLTSQPDLNWENPEVMQSVKDILQFWIDMGVDGFRLDAVNYFTKDPQYRDEPKDPEFIPGVTQPFYELLHLYMRDQEGTFRIIKELETFVSERGDRFLITEAIVNQKGIDAIPMYKKYYGASVRNNIIPFNFEFIRIPWEAKAYKNFITKYLASLTPLEIPSYVFGNHDKPRLATRIGQEQARAAAVLLLTLPGLPTIYYGEELGMENVSIPTDMIHDEKEFSSPGFGRDPVRTPMQWDASLNAGFTTGEPWLPLEDLYTKRNVESQRSDPYSMLSLYKSLLTLRSGNDALREGDYETIDSANEYIYVFTRTKESNKMLILINFSSDEQIVSLPFDRAEIVIASTRRSHAKITFPFTMQPNEACIFSLSK